MPRSSTSLLSTLLLLAACAGGSGPDGAGPAALAHPAGEERQLAYTQVDSTALAVDVGGEVVDVFILEDAALDMALAPTAGGVRVTAVWTGLDVEMTNPMGAPERATEEDVEGPVVFTMDGRGRTEVVSLPELQGRASQLVVPQAVAEGFFPRLPGTPPTPGMTWTDTVAYVADLPDAANTSETVMTYTVAGDTLVDGTTLLKVRMQGTGTLYQEGTTQGMDFFQNLTGTVEGYFLWDLGRGVMRYRRSEVEYGGTMDVTAAPMPLAVTMRGVSHVRLMDEAGAG
jgi:hypothetical protein